ncbi:hypothetical protein FHS19_003043 [Paenibacillus rhizosphaerae]|uniref:YxlC family protein n=1 Tax=Paenibacillus rhizosphaerae TaxID=297318 RepID=A0A839TSY1_9BACL|nr:YxlC family protein [Paenibacillus rhizosphaerae]MBB3128389.1 hypothetical protein [Paenibacillus rhizosphaerae]
MKRNKGTRERFAGLNEQDHTDGESFHEESLAEDPALIAELLHGFDQMELAIRKPDPPPLHELAQFVAAEQQRLRKRAVLEVALFLIIALALIASNLLLASMNIVVFVVIQGLVFVGAIAFAVRFFYRSKEKVRSGHA